MRLERKEARRRRLSLSRLGIGNGEVEYAWVNMHTAVVRGSIGVRVSKKLAEKCVVVRKLCAALVQGGLDMLDLRSQPSCRSRCVDDKDVSDTDGEVQSHEGNALAARGTVDCRLPGACSDLSQQMEISYLS